MTDCSQCQNLSVQIRLPNDLRRAIRLAAAGCSSGRLRHLGEGAYGDPFPQLAKTESWGDFVNSYFACTACGALFRLQAETYHGSGGTLGRISQISEPLTVSTGSSIPAGGA